jgi:hypothetical protein
MMTMSNNPEVGGDGQLRLELEVAKSNKAGTVVVSFVDAATRALRQEALERIKSGGIFEPPGLHRSR